MSETKIDISAEAQGLRELQVHFEFIKGSQLVTGDRITGFPSYVQGGTPVMKTSIVIDALPDGSDRIALQRSINQRASELATVAQALALASAELAEAVGKLSAGH